jgi:AraC-like DNA-binding protein
MSFLIRDGYHKNTAEISGRESFDYWKDIICDEFVRLDCEQTHTGVFEGELRGGVSIAELRFAEVVSDPQHVIRSKRQIARSAEEDFLISFQLAQQGLVKQNGREALLKPGSFALYDSTQPYSLTFNERFHQFVVQMPKAVLSRHLMNPEQYTAIAISSQSGLGAVLGNFVFSLVAELHNLKRAPDELSENLVTMIAMAFSSSVMLEQVGDNSVIKESLKRRIRQYIDNNLCNPDLSNQHIADAQGISTRYLHKLFQNEAETIHALIMSKRLDAARELLEDPLYSGHSIEKIAYSVGFSSPGHFSRCFKKSFGVSPSDVRPAPG